MSGSLRTVLSGFALATSWTWCIGMFAPIVIGQLMGWPGIVAFAIPNILGCALFGYLRSAERSREETRDHATMMAFFSAATIAYQVFFAGWLWGPVLGENFRMTPGEGTALASGAIFGAAVLLAAIPRGVLWMLAALAYPLSLLTFAFLPWSFIFGGESRGIAFNSLALEGAWAPIDLALVLPTIVFGFALSPNLDLTFHRARQEVPAGARPTSFAVFGVTFASMLVLTVCYLAAGPGALNNPAVRSHLAIQLALTSALHLSELRLVRIAPNARLVLGLGAGFVGLLAALLVPNRDTYLRFLGLYGLLFPAYAFLALRLVGRPRPIHWIALLASLAVVTPLLDQSFTDEPTLWTPLAVIVPVGAVLLVTRRRRVPA
jgi:hypothetical protein